MVMKIVWVVMVLVIALLVYAATRPDSFRLERQTTIQAPPEKIFAHLNDFNKWTAWSPWEKLDPNMKRTYGASTIGKGATYAWAGDKVGAGSMEILESNPSASLKIKLDFTKPFEARNLVDFTLKPMGVNGADGIQVTWAMYGPMAFINKLFGVFMSMDKMVGKDFEAGLRDLKAVSEK